MVVLTPLIQHERSSRFVNIPISSTSRDMIAQFEDSLITTVRKSLVDELAQVREAAASTFENLHNTIGHRALDGVLPNVFQQLVSVYVCLCLWVCVSECCFCV